MQHEIPVLELGPDGPAMARAVTTCVHCGFCLAACPTYRVLGEEMDSPRGRIVLMKQALEGGLSISDAVPYVDRCLGCLACETACPSGVRYRDLVVPFRARAERQARSFMARTLGTALVATLESPALFRLAVVAGRAGRWLKPLLPRGLDGALDLVPRRLPPRVVLPRQVAAVGRRRARVALLAGCVQQVLGPAINAATLRVLALNGVEVIVPPGQGCCGALATHAGMNARGDRRADHNRSVFPTDIDAIITNAAGCGSAMKDREARTPVKDVSEFLDAIGLNRPPSLEERTVVAYHDACHLSHGQGVRAAPRRLLSQVGNLELAEVEGGDTCCGSAGLYNLEQPAIASSLGRRKAEAIRATGARVVAAGNIGCLTQIETHLAAAGATVAVRHTIEVLDSAYSAADSRT